MWPVPGLLASRLQLLQDYECRLSTSVSACADNEAFGQGPYTGPAALGLPEREHAVIVDWLLANATQLEISLPKRHSPKQERARIRAVVGPLIRRHEFEVRSRFRWLDLYRILAL